MLAGTLLRATIDTHEGLLRELAALHQSVALREWDAVTRSVEQMRRVAQHYERRSNATAYQESSALWSQQVAVAQGRDPATGLRIPSPMRETQAVLCDALLRRAAELVRASLTPMMQRLEAAREQVGNALLAAVQSGLLAPAAADTRFSLREAQGVWAELCRKGEQYALLDRRLRTQLHEADIYVLVMDTLRRWSAARNDWS